MSRKPYRARAWIMQSMLHYNNSRRLNLANALVMSNTKNTATNTITDNDRQSWPEPLGFDFTPPMSTYQKRTDSCRAHRTLTIRREVWHRQTNQLRQHAYMQILSVRAVKNPVFLRCMRNYLECLVVNGDQFTDTIKIYLRECECADVQSHALVFPSCWLQGTGHPVWYFVKCNCYIL